MSPIHYKAPCPTQWGGLTDECAMALSWGILVGEGGRAESNPNPILQEGEGSFPKGRLHH